MWPEVPLGEVTVNFDALRVPVREGDRRPGPYPYYGASGVVDHVDAFIFDGDYLLIAEDGENLRSRNTPIAFMASGKFWVNNHAHIVRGNARASTRFLCYALSVAEVGGFLTGSAIPKLTQGNMNQLPVALPPLAVQGAIVDVLGALDDKIQLNRRMSETLEETARALFKSWFVDFDPVRAKAEGRQPFGMDAATAALFPDSFEESELGEVPKGWKCQELRERASLIQYGLTTSATTAPPGPKFLRITDIQGGRVSWNDVPYCVARDEELGKYRIADGDILVARTGASTGENIYIVDPPIAVFASYLVRLRFPTAGESRFVGAFMRTERYRQHVTGTMGGSAQPNASAQALASARAVFPSEAVASQFGDVLAPLDSRIAANGRENTVLAELRDYLLPKLLSGEIRVKEAEHLLEQTP